MVGLGELHTADVFLYGNMNFKCSALNLSGVSLGENRPHAALQLIHSGSNSNIHKPFDSLHPTDFKHIYRNGKKLSTSIFFVYFITN